jgi:hypothetical protein
LGFGFVSAQSQATAGILLRQSLAQTQKSSLKTATLFLKTLQRLENMFNHGWTQINTEGTQVET